MAQHAREEEEPAFQRGRLVPRLHDDESYVGTAMYFDEELQVPAGRPHGSMNYETGPVLKLVAEEAGLMFLSDNPIWYLHPENDEQKVFYGDWVFARSVDHRRVTANDLLLVIEIVTTSERKKEVKDTVFQRALNEFNEVPEFGLVFPDAGDPRALVWHRLEGGRYQEIAVAPGGSIDSKSVPGLEFSVRPQSEWTEGRKLRVFYRGKYRRSLEEERQRAERLVAKLKELGVDPEG